MPELSKTYEPADVEARWYAAWLRQGCFQPGPENGRAPYVIVIPPPNVTGVLTMGHVLNNSLQDVLVRRARLEGRAALWIPGTDHAGIATQTRVERELRQTEGKTRRDLGREAFLDRVRTWRGKYGGIIIEQLKRLGCSCDWERTQFTMDPAYSHAVLTAFVRLFRSGRIYRGKRMVNWCPASLTALSDEEVEMRPTQGVLYTVRYERVDRPGEYVTVSTTRPETIPGDTALAVHPDDERYRDLVGRQVWRPLQRAPIPVVADRDVDPSFGAGALKVTPAHDKVDFAIGQRHGLPIVDVLRPDGVLNDLAGPELAGLERFAGRRRAAELLRANGALVEEKPYENNVGYSERAGVPIEPRLTQQWWLRYPRVDEAKEVVRDGTVTFHPERWGKVYLNWLEGIQDWCISRQLWWGHRIPVWYRRGLDREALTEVDLADPTRVHVSVEGPPDPENWEQEEDVLDTWASSWLWPLATLGWPDPEAEARAGLARFYPTTTLVTGPDIIFFWVARMIMAGLEFRHDGVGPAAERVPFRHVYFTGIIRDLQGRKMSKSLGNSPDPLDLIAKYGADGLRFGLLQIAPLGQDIRFDEARVEGGRNFCNKLWNAARFRQLSGPRGDNSSLGAVLARIQPGQLDRDDHALLRRLLGTTENLERALAGFEFAAATQALYGFFWNDFCDWYVEVAKARVQEPATRDTVLAVQDLVLRQFLLLFAPFAPFITEELWRELGYGAEGTFLQEARLETAAELAAALAAAGVEPDPAAEGAVARLQAAVAAVRQLKAERGAASRRDVGLDVMAGDEDWALVAAAAAKLGRLLGAVRLERTQGEVARPAVVTPLGTFYLDLGAAADPEAERARLGRELDKVRAHIAATEARLGNPAFAGKAPPAVIEGARRQLAEQQARRDELERLLRAV